MGITILLILTFSGSMFGLSDQQVYAQDGSGDDQAVPPTKTPEKRWTDPTLISTTTPTSWFPDVAVDVLGRVHVVWDSQYWPEFTDEGGYDVVMYSLREGDTWTEPHDVAPANIRGHITRPSVAVDLMGRVHVLYTGYGHVLYHTTAKVKQAQHAIAWEQSLALASFGYISDIEIDQEGIIHTVYDTFVSTEATEEELMTNQIPEMMADIFYRRSADGGRTWSAPTYLMTTPRVGSARAQLEIDRRGTLHIAWDEGWDRWTLHGTPRYGVYMQSQDGGLSWSPPITFTQPTADNAHTSVAADGEGGVMLAWRTLARNELYYTWSGDDGLSWSQPITIPGIYSRSWSNTPFDAYDMEADSAGRIHLVAAARTRLARTPLDCVPLGIYHLVWDKNTFSWSTPHPIALYECDTEGKHLYPEYPKLDIARGNQLHVVWFTRDDPWRLGDYSIWYSQSQADAPFQVPPPTPEPSPPPTATPGPTPTPTATPVTLQISSAPLELETLYTENDDVLQVLIATSPIILIGAALFVFRKLWARHHL